MARSLRVAAVGDLHCTRASEGVFQPIFAKVAESADVLVLCGDLTDYGTAEEARVLAKELSATKVPTLAVLGNHDFESSAAPEVTQILADAAGVIMLDGTATEVLGVGFAGVKGFAGGFGESALQAWGEEPIKAFVRAALEEALKLESALARLRTPGRVAVLHYAPIRETAGGESVEIFPFLGCSRLEEPLNRYPVTAVVHGHAHNGCPEGASAECGSARPSASPTTWEVAAVPRNWQPPPGLAHARQPRSDASSRVIWPWAKRTPML